MENLTFPQRVRSMQAAVEHLRALLVIVEQEAEAMAEVQKRFAAKKPAKDGSIYSLAEKCMGIDIYAEWRGMTQEEKNAQITGFNAAAGYVGICAKRTTASRMQRGCSFPRRSSRATQPFPPPCCARLPAALRAAEQRERTVYGETVGRRTPSTK